MNFERENVPESAAVDGWFCPRPKSSLPMQRLNLRSSPEAESGCGSSVAREKGTEPQGTITIAAVSAGSVSATPLVQPVTRQQPGWWAEVWDIISNKTPWWSECVAGEVVAMFPRNCFCFFIHPCG